MDDIQFMQALKAFFFEYFLAEELGEKPSMLNLQDLVDEFKENVILEHENEENRFLFDESYPIEAKRIKTPLKPL